MTVRETVANLVQRIREADQETQGAWSIRGRQFALIDDAERIVVDCAETHQSHSSSDWSEHPGVFVLDTFGYSAVDGTQAPTWALPPEIALASWVLDDGALEAVVAANVMPEYARAAHLVGVTDAWELIELWRSGVPVEYLNAL